MNLKVGLNAILVILFLVQPYPGYSKSFDYERVNHNAMVTLAKALKVDIKEIQKVRKAGYGLEEAMLLIVISQESKQPVEKIMDMTDEGLSWEDMAKRYPFSVEQAIQRCVFIRKDHPIKMPPSTVEERKTASITPRALRQKKEEQNGQK